MEVTKMGREVKKWLILILGILLLGPLVSVARANDLTGRLGIGLGWSYLSLKYGIMPNFALEVRYASSEGITAWGPRGYYNFDPYDCCSFFTGLGMDFVNFVIPADNDDEKEVSGSGYTASAFVGREYFINDNFTLNADIGPVYIDLTEGEFDLDVDGIEFVANLGINFYFGSSHQFEDKPFP